MLTTTGEEMIRTNDVEICVSSIGDPADPTILLIHGAGHSLLSWPDELCRRLAESGRHVIRYDSRDAGRSSSYPRASLATRCVISWSTPSSSSTRWAAKAPTFSACRRGPPSPSSRRSTIRRR